jgi:hypothetical protein
MITLKQAIKVLRLPDSEWVWLLDDERKAFCQGKLMSVREMKNKFDLTQVYVSYIREEYDRDTGVMDGYTFIIRERRN